MPFDHIAIDLASEFPLTQNKKLYLLIVIDVCTRFIFLRSLRSKSAAEIGKKLGKIFCDVGLLKVIQSDNGSEFSNVFIQALTSHCGIDHRLVTPYHPQGNGLAENSVKQ